MCLPGKKCDFSFSCSKAAEQREVRTTATIGPCVPIIFFGSVSLCGFSRGVKVADTAGVGETNDKVCEMTDAPVRIKPGVWKSFGFPVSKNRKGGKVMDAHAVMFKVQLLFTKQRQLSFNLCWSLFTNMAINVSYRGLYTEVSSHRDIWKSLHPWCSASKLSDQSGSA